MARERIIILGAAGRDFHNFNVVYRNDRKSAMRIMPPGRAGAD